jgi:hypothetical protein
MILLTAAIAAFLFAQDGGTYPPKPGEIPNYGLLVGPAAERYRELLKNEDKLFVSRAQLALLDTQMVYLRLMSGTEPVDNTRRIEAEKAIVAAAAELRKVQAEFLKKYNHEPDCYLDGKQEAVCPAKKTN